MEPRQNRPTTPCDDTRTPLVLDLFAGPGGWDEGVRDLGIAPLGIEWDADACATAEAAGHARRKLDVRDVDPAALVAEFGPVRGLIASPPCQGFSTAGKGHGRRDSAAILAALATVNTLNDVERILVDLTPLVVDDKSLLALEPLRFALALTPSWLAWEQVPAVLPLWDACAAVLRRIGYSVDTGLLSSERYGVPQTRKRALLVARAPWATTLLGPAKLPTPTHSRYYSTDRTRLDPDVLPWVSMAQVLGWDDDAATTLEAVKAMGSGMVARHGTRPGRPADAPAFTVTGNASGMAPGGFRLAMRSNYGTGGDPARRGERLLDEPAATVTGKAGRSFWTLNTAGRTGLAPRNLDEPAATITGKGTAYVFRNGNQANSAKRPLDTPAPTIHFGARSNKVEVLPADVADNPASSGRRITVDEAAVLQSFPADYPWQGNTTSRYQQVGNAVPPGLARVVVAAVTGLTVAAADAEAAA